MDRDPWRIRRWVPVLLGRLVGAVPGGAAVQRRLTGWHARRLVRGAWTPKTWFGAPVGVLETTGRRTGLQRQSPVLVLELDGQLVALAANAGAATPPAWLLNLRDEPRAGVFVGGRRLEVAAWEAEGDERARLWAAFAAAYPAAEGYERRAGRPLPVVVLERRGG